MKQIVQPLAGGRVEVLGQHERPITVTEGTNRLVDGTQTGSSGPRAR